MDPTILAQLMQMFGGAGAAPAAGGLAGALGGAATAMPVAAGAPIVAEALPALSTAGAMPPMAANPPMFGPAAAPQMGSGMFGVEGVTPGVMGMAEQGAGPLSANPVAQGTGGLLAGGIPMDEGTIDKLSSAPLDPNMLLKMLSQQSGGGATRTKTVGGGGASSPGKMGQLEISNPKAQRASLSQLMGR